MEHRPSHDAVTWDPRNTNGPSGDEPRNAQSQAGAVIGSGALVDGRYRLESIIGAGGMGVVWAATHERLDRKVALKQIPLVVPGGEPAERIRARTLREARITASLNEVDGVVRIANYFDDEHNVWLELEYLDALNLAELIQATGGLPPAEVAWIGARVARALAGGHELEPPVQHRDIKPGNVLVSRDAAAVKLSDYGISRRDGDPAVTMIGAIHATLPYAAPEVVREHFTTVESDIWSLGATLYHAVEGRLPYGDHDSNQSLIEAVRAADIQPMGRAGPQLGPILERMLVVNPASRIDADTAAEKLERIAAPLGAQTRTHLSHYRPHRRTTLVHETVTRPTPEPVAPQRKRGRLVALGALVLVVLAGLGVGIGAAVAAWPRTVVPAADDRARGAPDQRRDPRPARAGRVRRPGQPVARRRPVPPRRPARAQGVGRDHRRPGRQLRVLHRADPKGSSVTAALTIEVGDGNTPPTRAGPPSTSAASRSSPAPRRRNRGSAATRTSSSPTAARSGFRLLPHAGQQRRLRPALLARRHRRRGVVRQTGAATPCPPPPPGAPRSTWAASTPAGCSTAAWSRRSRRRRPRLQPVELRARVVQGGCRARGGQPAVPHAVPADRHDRRLPRAADVRGVGVRRERLRGVRRGRAPGRGRPGSLGDRAVRLLRPGRVRRPVRTGPEARHRGRRQAPPAPS